MNPTNALPDGLLVTYYGDDFTGSSDVLQVFSAAGLETVLFLETPTPELLSRFPNARVVGVAGMSRAHSPDWMQAHLPAVFDALNSLRAPVLLYKVCSTFDSSPTVGSIGCAIDIGIQSVGGDWSPMVVGAPTLKRYQMFGHLFAVADGVGHRLDRHPTMSRHPSTPMDEADLRLHLSKQTDRSVELIDFLQLQHGRGSQRREALRGAHAPIVLHDIIDTQCLEETGKTIWNSPTLPVFTASSSGLPAALIAYWRTQGWIAAVDALPPTPCVQAVFVISGSCSPQTAAQIEFARQHGYVTSRLNVDQVLHSDQRAQEINRLTQLSVNSLKSGQSVLVYSASGPDDEAVQTFHLSAQRAGMSKGEAAHIVGAALAAVTRNVVQQTPVRRIGVAGGDSSGAVMQALDTQALTIASALQPGVPLCRTVSSLVQFDGLEVALKGGQMGSPDFCEILRTGQSSLP